MFTVHEAEVQENTFNDVVDAQKMQAKTYLLRVLTEHPSLEFSDVLSRLLHPFMIRETDVEDICVALADDGKIDRTWGTRNCKPKNSDIIRLRRP